MNDETNSSAVQDADEPTRRTGDRRRNAERPEGTATNERRSGDRRRKPGLIGLFRDVLGKN